MKLKELKAKMLTKKARDVKYIIEEEFTFSNSEEEYAAHKRMQGLLHVRGSANRDRAYHIHKTNNSVQLKYRKKIPEPLT